MHRFFVAIAAAGILFAAPALAQTPASTQSADVAAQTQTSGAGISQDLSARHYYRGYRYRHYRHYGWYRGHHWGWRHRHWHHRHWY